MVAIRSHRLPLLAGIALFLLCCSSSLTAQEVKVTAEIETPATTGQPLEGTITVTHDKSQKVNSTSFRLEGQSLTAERVKSVQLSPLEDLMLTIYRFSLPEKPAGIHVLEEVSVMVGGKLYRSIPSTYIVQEPAQSKPRVKAKTKNQGVRLELEAFADGSQPLYPGQRARFGYRYYYNVSFDLTQEELPLLQAKGFKKVGAKQIRETNQGKGNIFEVYQEVEAETPGSYTFGPSVIEGFPYITGVFGRKQYGKNKLRAEAPAITVVVKPFPEEGRPSSFNGSVGEFTGFTAQLLPKPNLVVGDKISLVLEITGQGDMSTVTLPPIANQPGILGFFRISDLPPVGETEEGRKKFVVELRPLTASIEQIPRLSFSFFHPTKRSYQTLQSEPIPITVAPFRKAEEGGAEAPKEQERVEWQAKLRPIAIQGNESLTPSDLEPLRFGSWWVLLWIPLGIAGLFLQLQLRKYLQQKEGEERAEPASGLFEKAWRQKEHPDAFYREMNEAFTALLHERGEIASRQISPEQLPKEGAPGQVRELLLALEKQRYAGEEKSISDEQMQKIRELFQKWEGSA